MTKRLNTFLLATVAAGTMLLAACGQAEQGAPTATTSGNQSMGAGTSKPSPTKAATAPSEVEPVECGPVTLPAGATHTLVADSTTDGRVGCTEAFTVMDEFVNLPAEKHGTASLGDVALSNGWSCTMDDGETTAVACIKGKSGVALHTVPTSK
jgi:hypothetical protein